MNKSLKICNDFMVDERKYPCLKELRFFLEKIPTLGACYLSGAIVQKKITNIESEPIIRLYIILEEITHYICAFVRKKAETLIKDHFFPKYVFIEVIFIQNDHLNKEAKFK